MRTVASPAVQMREQLEYLRRGGVPFATAWPLAVSRCVWPHDTQQRWEYKALFGDLEAARLVQIRRADVEAHMAKWKAAYDRAPVTRADATLSQLSSATAA